MKIPPLSFHDFLEEQWDEEEETEEIETVLKVVPPVYHQYLDVFSNVKAEKLPPHRACDHHIELEGLLTPVGVIYSLSNQESETLLAYISENVEKGFIRPSSSSTGAPVLFVKKKDGGLCLCVDYRKLNSVTRKNRYPVPTMNQLINVFNGSTIFSKIDLHGSYNLLRIKEGDEHLTAFRTKYGSYEYLVKPFGLKNGPAYFQNLVKDIFSDFLDISVVVYLDEIKVFSSSEDEHVRQVASVLQRLRDNNLFSKASKCVFHASSVEYLGYVFSRWILQKLITLPDALSHWENVYLERGVDLISKNPQNSHQIIKQHGIKESRFFSIKVEIFSDLVDQIQKEVWQDKDYKEIFKQLERGESVSDYSLEPQAKLLLFKDRMVIQSNEKIQLNILQKHHDSPLAGHPGQEKTLKLIKSNFYWAGMDHSIKEYVSSCQKCPRNKKIHHKKFGLLKPLHIPPGPWNSLSMDLITQFLLHNSVDSTLVVVDRFSKMAIFIPAYRTITSLDLAQIFINHVFSKHGAPVSIVSDRGPLFVSSLWTDLCDKLKISRDLSAYFHPETD
ncbi:hypothetical protein O181_039330 [Austropuccinia psidii MF-1]|uniref:Integrase catalytic domain-containing protein n=1 Tax=Austropuccinia psidii MF-1 TaxID=1389203 RepID=A0A9Q3HF25_9BASI|nr:hypothetical protein [Austropuccinia psidii MF-1]